MPYTTEWVAPEVLLRHRGVTVYFTYKSGDMNQGGRTCWFSLNNLCGEDECVCGDGKCRNVFDVRDLPNWAEDPHPPFLCGREDTRKNRAAWNRYHAERKDEKHREKIIREALDRGILVPDKGIVSAAGNRPHERTSRAGTKRTR